MDFLFFLKKTLSIYLNPVTVTLELLFTAFALIVFSRRRPKKPRGPKRKRFARFCGSFGVFLGLCGILFLFLISIDPVTGGLVSYLERQHPPLPEKDGEFIVEVNPEFIVVLPGGQQNVEGRPELSRLNYSSYVRLTSATRIWKQFPESKLVFTGHPLEIDAMTSIAVRFDVPESSIVTETESRDTKDHPVFVKPILGDAPFLLVTSGTHMPRAMRLFEGQGLKPVPAAVDLWFWPEAGNQNPYQPGYLVPRAANVYSSSVAMHELLGMAWAKLLNQDDSAEEGTIEL